MNTTGSQAGERCRQGCMSWVAIMLMPVIKFVYWKPWEHRCHEHCRHCAVPISIPSSTAQHSTAQHSPGMAQLCLGVTLRSAQLQPEQNYTQRMQMSCSFFSFSPPAAVILLLVDLRSWAAGCNCRLRTQQCYIQGLKTYLCTAS